MLILPLPQCVCDLSPLNRSDTASLLSIGALPSSLRDMLRCCDLSLKRPRSQSFPIRLSPCGNRPAKPQPESNPGTHVLSVCHRTAVHSKNKSHGCLTSLRHHDAGPARLSVGTSPCCPGGLLRACSAAPPWLTVPTLHRESKGTLSPTEGHQ